MSKMAMKPTRKRPAPAAQPKPTPAKRVRNIQPFDVSDNEEEDKEDEPASQTIQATQYNSPFSAINEEEISSSEDDGDGEQSQDKLLAHFKAATRQNTTSRPEPQPVQRNNSGKNSSNTGKPDRRSVHKAKPKPDKTKNATNSKNISKNKPAYPAKQKPQPKKRGADSQDSVSSAPGADSDREDEDDDGAYFKYWMHHEMIEVIEQHLDPEDEPQLDGVVRFFTRAMMLKKRGITNSDLHAAGVWIKECCTVEVDDAIIKRIRTKMGEHRSWVNRKLAALFAEAVTDIISSKESAKWKREFNELYLCQAKLNAHNKALVDDLKNSAMTERYMETGTVMSVYFEGGEDRDKITKLFEPVLNVYAEKVLYREDALREKLFTVASNIIAYLITAWLQAKHGKDPDEWNEKVIINTIISRGDIRGLWANPPESIQEYPQLSKPKNYRTRTGKTTAKKLNPFCLQADRKAFADELHDRAFMSLANEPNAPVINPAAREEGIESLQTALKIAQRSHEIYMQYAEEYEREAGRLMVISKQLENQIVSNELVIDKEMKLPTLSDHLAAVYAIVETCDKAIAAEKERNPDAIPAENPIVKDILAQFGAMMHYVRLTMADGIQQRTRITKSIRSPAPESNPPDPGSEQNEAESPRHDGTVSPTDSADSGISANPVMLFHEGDIE